MNIKQYAMGAAIEPRHKRVEREAQNRAQRRAEERAAVERPMRSDAHALAIANQHKPWARRWLRAHREYLRANGLIEISL